jgi:hypothetical protein
VAKKKSSETKKDTSISVQQKRGFRHLLECRCVLPQFKNRQDPPKHKFIVFSVLKENDSIDLKYAQCNNCGLIHKVIDICKSEIQLGKEHSSSILTVEDIKLSLPRDLSNILEKYRLELPSWEQAQFIVEHKSWGEFIVLEQEDDGDTKQGKYVRILGESFFKVENFSRDEFISTI